MIQFVSMQLLTVLSCITFYFCKIANVLLLFLHLVSWVFSLFFFIPLAKGLPILLILSKNQLLVSLIFCFPILYFIYLCSDLYYFLISASSGFSLRFFFRLLKVQSQLLIRDLSFSSKEACVAVNFPPSYAFAVSSTSRNVVIFVFISFKIFSHFSCDFFDPLVVYACVV